MINMKQKTNKYGILKYKLQVGFTEKQKENLKQRSEYTGETRGTIIRRAVTEYFEKGEK